MKTYGLPKSSKRMSVVKSTLHFVASIALIILIMINNDNPIANSSIFRNKHQSPFAADSIWNMPIGSRARYRSAEFQPAHFTGGDTDHYIVTNDQDPLVPWYQPGNWGSGRCTGSVLTGHLRVPSNLVVPDATATQTPNNAAAFLQPNGRTLVQVNALARCVAGGAVYGYTTPGHPKKFENIYGSGITGGHGGSGLSSIGGTIRLRELLPSSGNIRHVLKLNVDAHRYLYQKSPGYRWPAVRSDAYAFDPGSPDRYGGTNPALTMGALLAIPPQVKKSELKLKTRPAKKLFDALQNYGSYIADDTAWDAYAICVENGVETEFEQAYGYSFGAYSGDFHDDINRLFQALQIVDNNSSQTVGGGGKPRRSLAPPIGN